MKKYKNSLQKGSVRFIVFHEDDVWYATALEFNIVEVGSTPQEALLLLFEAAQGYLESAKKIKARPQILNQVVDAEYARMWERLESTKPTERPKSVFTFGRMNLPELRKERLLVSA